MQKEVDLKKLSEELKILIEKLFDALEKKQKCLEFEDKVLDKIEAMLSVAAPHIFWDEEQMDDDDEDIGEVVSAKKKIKF